MSRLSATQIAALRQIQANVDARWASGCWEWTHGVSTVFSWSEVAVVWGPEIGSLRTLRALVERGLVEVRSTTSSAVVLDHRGCSFGRWNGSRRIESTTHRVHLTEAGRAAIGA